MPSLAAILSAVRKPMPRMSRQPVGVLADDAHRFGAVGLVDPDRPRGADPVGVQEQHDLADHLLLRPAGHDAPRALRPDAGDLIFRLDHAGVFQLSREQRALGIEIGADMVRDFSGVFADADAAILGRGPKPDRALLRAAFQHLPVAHMVAAVGAGPDRLFIGKILAAAEIIEIADRRVLVRPIEQHAADDLDR